LANNWALSAYGLGIANQSDRISQWNYRVTTVSIRVPELFVSSSRIHHFPA